MTGLRWFKLGLVTAVAVLGASGASGATGRVDRQGVYNLGGWFQYGLIEGESRYGLDFSTGPGYNLHFRYNVSRRAALVFAFDSQTYDARADSLVEFKLTGVHAGVRLFSLPAGDVLRYFEASVGFYRPEIEFPRTQEQSIGDEVCFPKEGFLVHAGAGIEIFFTQAWAAGLGVHGYGLSGKGLCRGEPDRGEKPFSVAGQVSVGVEYYLFR